METALFWVEYIARHKGAPHLRSSSVRLSLLCYHNVDVFVSIVIILALIGLILIKCARFGNGCFRKVNKCEKIKRK